MALLFVDGFDAQDHQGKWDTASSALTGSSTTRYGTGSSRQCVISAGAGNTSKKLYAAASTVYAGFAFWADASGTSGFVQPMVIFYGDAGATQHLWIGYHGITRKWEVRVNNWGGTQLAVSADTYAGSSWVYVEIMVVIHASTGRVKLNINGATVIDYTGVTKNGGTNNTSDAIGIGTQADFGTGAAKMYYDDLYVCDSTGTVNNGFLGEVRVPALLPNGAGASTQWTSSTGLGNWDNVNDVPPVDSTLNYSPTTGQRDTYSLSDTAISGTVLGVQVASRMSNSAAGVGAKTAVKSGATVAYGVSRSLTTTPITYLDVLEADPNTSAAWTATAVNAIEVGAEVV